MIWLRVKALQVVLRLTSDELWNYETYTYA
jgi:hypothetical protein